MKIKSRVDNVTWSLDYAPTYERLDGFLGKRGAIKIGNNTYAERLGDDVIGIRLHQTHVVIMSSCRIVLHSGGWRSAITKDRINTFLPYPWRLVQERGRWNLYKIVCTNGERNCWMRQAEFYDGVVIELDARRPVWSGQVVPADEVRA